MLTCFKRIHLCLSKYCPCNRRLSCSKTKLKPLRSTSGCFITQLESSVFSAVSFSRVKIFQLTCKSANKHLHEFQHSMLSKRLLRFISASLRRVTSQFQRWQSRLSPGQKPVLMFICSKSYIRVTTLSCGKTWVSLSSS